MNKNEAQVGERTRADMEAAGNETIENLLRKRGFFDTLDAKDLEQSLPDLKAA